MATALIADDHSLYRSGLALLLSDQLDYDEVLEAGSLSAASEIMDARPGLDLALFDLAMPGMNGVDSLTPLLIRYPGVKIAIVTASDAKCDVLNAIGAGVCGFLPKTLPCEEFVEAVNFIRSGRIYVPALMRTVSQSIQKPQTAESSPAGTLGLPPSRQLTSRQKDVLDCLRRGMTNREIASELTISVATVKVHVGALLAMLNAKNRIQLAQMSK